MKMFIFAALFIGCLNAYHVPPKRHHKTTSPPVYHPLGCKDEPCRYQDGYYAYSKDPNQFYYCQGKINFGCQKCPTNLIYSERCKACRTKYDEKNYVPCQSNPGTPGVRDDCAPKGFCKRYGVIDGKYNVDPYDKTKFFACIHGVPTACQKCQDGLFFSEKCQQCLRREKYYECENNPTGPGEEPTCDEPMFCMHRKNGNYEAGKNKGYFYTCSNGSCLKRICAPKGTVYVPKCGQCEFYDVYYKTGCTGDAAKKHYY